MNAKLRSLLAKMREGWLVLGVTLLLFILLETALSLFYVIKDRIEASDRTASSDVRAKADAYAGAPWVNAYYKEFENASIDRWVSYVYWRRAPYQGKHIRIDADGIRRTWSGGEAHGAASDPLIVFALGGSAMWGTGARDDFTIPSFLARQFKAKGIDAEVTNFGEPGYVSTQEVILLFRQLQKGNIPDVVIFYDGANDTYSAYQQQTAGLPQNEFNRAKEFNLSQATHARPLRALCVRRGASELSTVRFARNILRRLGISAGQDAMATHRVPQDDSPSRREALSREVLALYASNVRLVKVLGQSYGFKTLFYWQPTIFDKRRLTGYEESQRRSIEALQPLYEQVRSHMRAGDVLAEHADVFHDLGDTFSGVPGPVFIDWCHVSESGNEAIAGRMAVDVLRGLGSLDSAGG
jgi:hypothetical protein